MAEQHNTDVLIIGAGPTGLLMACQLAIHNVPFRIVDKTEDHTTQSRALVIQARSLEILHQAGISAQALEQGTIAGHIGSIFNGKKLLRLTVKEIGEGMTRFPFLLMLEQSRTEALLNSFLEERGHRVERQTELRDLSQDKNGVTAALRTSDGTPVLVRAKYLLGADGAHSFVRKKLGIEFGGRTFEQSLFVVDCKAEVDVARDEMCLAFSPEGVAGYFPLTNGRWRVLGTLPRGLEKKEKITFNDIRPGFSERMRMPVKLYDEQWMAIYHAHHRYASTFRAGRCFIAGDAAHIHSPVGAQGMNTGLQDAYNLAWKIAFVLKGRAGEQLLDTYTEERIRVAKNLVRTTDNAFRVVTSRNFFFMPFRLYIVPFFMRLLFPLVERSKVIRRIAFRYISEIGISYRHGSLALHATSGRFPRRAPKPGDRWPFLVSGAIDLQEKVRADRFTLFLFAVNNNFEKMSFDERFDELIATETVPSTDQTRSLYSTLGIRTNGWYLVRPDGYVACRSTQPGMALLEGFLARHRFVNKH